MRAGWDHLWGRFTQDDPALLRLLAPARGRHRRYLARQAMRIGRDRFQAARLMMEALRSHPPLLFVEPRRTLLTLAAALAVAVAPRALALSLFARQGV